MMRGKHTRPMPRIGGVKLMVMTAALALVMCCLIGGTVAWLITDTEPVVNTFTYGDINIKLEETDTGDDADLNTNTYKMIPGNEITKDPTVTVLADSEDAWLFVKLEKTANFDQFMTYEMADGWTALDGADGVYYREVDKDAADVAFEIIKGDTVYVSGDVTKEMLNELDKDGADNNPQLTVTAYAVQRDATIDAIDTAAEAWALIGSSQP